MRDQIVNDDIEKGEGVGWSGRGLDYGMLPVLFWTVHVVSMW